jgi:uncharacterized protein (TIGR02453 family)
MAARHFTRATFSFLRELAADNDRTWFHEHKDRYVETVQEPALEFIADFAPRLREISPHFLADARVVGGSLFRIQRDTRFSKDKTPYKTNTGVQFRHEAGKDAHAPGFYLHIEPTGSYAGVGLWRPETKDAYRVRAAIADDPASWRKASRGKRFVETWAPTGASLVRAPKGYDEDHPLIEDLKRKDFIASARLTQAQVVADDFIDTFEAMCRAAAPYVRFLCGAVDVPF